MILETALVADFQSVFQLLQPNATVLDRSTVVLSPPRRRSPAAATAASSDAEFENATAPSSARDAASTTERDLSSSAAIALGLTHPSIMPAYDLLATSIDRASSVYALLFLFRVAAALSRLVRSRTRPFVVSFEEDGVTSLEWLFSDARLVFAFESDGSGTYSLCNSGGESRFGDITPELQVEELLSVLLA